MGKIADICSEMWAERALQRGEYKNNWLVSIRDHGNSFFDESNYAIRGIFSIQFADIAHSYKEYPNEKPPTTEDIRSILEWSKDKQEIVVHCAAGVSRSSAVGYVIACSEMEPREALKVLNPALHSPLPWIVQLGSEILSKPEMIDCLISWTLQEKGMELGKRWKHLFK